jgi:RNA polymerase sigma factor (sigma-70 family)
MMHYLNSASRRRFDHFTLEAALAWGRHQNSDRYQSIKPITFLAERPNQPRHDSLQTSFSFHRHDGYHGATTQPRLSTMNARADPESSLELHRRARDGDAAALDRLLTRYLRPLQRWASGRLPRWARDLSDTGDLVQETLVQTLRNMGTFRPRREGALQAYLRQAVMNRIRDEIRRSRRRPASEDLGEHIPTDGLLSIGRSDKRRLSGTKRPSPSCVTRIARRSSLALSSGKVGKKSPPCWTNRRPPRPASPHSVRWFPSQ